MKKTVLIVVTLLIIVAVAITLFLGLPQSLVQDKHGKTVLRGTIVHSAEVDEGYLIYLNCPEMSDILYLLLVTEETAVEEKLSNWIKYGFVGDYVEAVVNSYTESDPISGQYVQLVESIKLYENS